MFKKTVHIMTALLFATFAFGGDLQVGYDAYQKGDFKTAFTNLEPLAAEADTTVQGYVADMYYLGNGVEKDLQKARYWYQQAATKGDAKAQVSLGYMYNYGEGIAQDYQQAIYWYQQSAQQDNPYAQLYLGDIYYAGHGVPTDYQQAKYWYTQSAKQSNYEAQAKLAEMYEKGEGVLQDYTLAYMWYNIAQYNRNTVFAGNQAVVQYLLEYKMLSLSTKMAGNIVTAQKMSTICVDSNYTKCGY